MIHLTDKGKSLCGSVDKSKDIFRRIPYGSLLYDLLHSPQTCKDCISVYFIDE